MAKKKIFLIILGSLLLCVLLALFINYKIKEHNKIYNLTYSVPVRVKYDQEKYNVSEVKSEVKVQFTGRKIDIHLANQASIIILDLTDYEASNEEYTVPYELECKVSNVECNLLEKETKVKITEK
jgi:YbbR domain-containing protein